MSSQSRGETAPKTPVPDQLMRSFTEGVVSYPQMGAGINTFMADTVVKSILANRYTWPEFETFQPTPEHIQDLGTVMDRIHKIRGIPVRTRAGAEAEEGFQGEIVDDSRLLKLVEAHHWSVIVAVSCYADAVLEKRQPKRRQNLLHAENFGDSYPLLARELFAQQSDGTAAEVQALGVMFGAMAESLRPTNPEAVRVKREWHSVYRDQMSAAYHDDPDFKDKVSIRGSSVSIAIRDIVSKSIEDSMPDIEAMLDYPLPPMLDEFVPMVTT